MLFKFYLYQFLTVCKELILTVAQTHRQALYKVGA